MRPDTQPLPGEPIDDLTRNIVPRGIIVHQRHQVNRRRPPRQRLPRMPRQVAHPHRPRPPPKRLHRHVQLLVHLPQEGSQGLRQAIFDGLRRRETYATSGPRIKLWFYLIDSAGEKPMGSVVTDFDGAPTFRVRAVGDHVDTGACQEEALVAATGQASFVPDTCRDTCYGPDRDGARRKILRLEVVRIRRQQAGEPLGALIDDPWQTLSCDGDDSQQGVEDCKATFTDDTFPDLSQDALYYVRAIQEQTPTINGDPLRCTRDEAGVCISSAPCNYGHDDDCAAMASERAWSSPIYLYRGQ